MDKRTLLEAARVARGLTQEAVARRSGTSQPTLSAYERGTKSPTLSVTQRILHALDFDLGLRPRVTFHQVRIGRRTYVVPNQLWRIDPNECFAAFTVGHGAAQLALYPGNRTSRVAAYAWLILHADEALMFQRLDGALLVDSWPDIAKHLPTELHAAWRPVVDRLLDAWWINQLAAGRPRRSKPVSARTRARAIREVAKHGLTEDEIRQLLRD